jgi:NurA domain
VALELNKLSGQVDQMGQAMAERFNRHRQLIEQAQATLAEHAQVSDELKAKIRQAHAVDQSWRGAEPLGERLDERHTPAGAVQPSATLIAADGSQIYPDRHAIATYYLLNTGSIVLRQGSGQAPSVKSLPQIFFEDGDLYDEAGRLRNAEHINRQRDRLELAALADLAEAERSALGGDIAQTILTLGDGPLLPWMPQRKANDTLQQEVAYLAGQFARLQRAHAVPTGYVDRPGSTYVLRTLELAGQSLEQINRQTVRSGRFRLLADRLLFAGLATNQRSGVFASTSEINDGIGEQGQRVAFFYANMGHRPGVQNAVIARIELPVWAAADPSTLDAVQNAIYEDCALNGFPYVLGRAHELAVVGTLERANLEAMLGQAMLRCGIMPATSAKAEYKRLMAARRR